MRSGEGVQGASSATALSLPKAPCCAAAAAAASAIAPAFTHASHSMRRRRHARSPRRACTAHAAQRRRAQKPKSSAISSPATARWPHLPGTAHAHAQPAALGRACAGGQQEVDRRWAHSGSAAKPWTSRPAPRSASCSL